MSTLKVLANHEMLSLQPNESFADSSAATPVLKLTCPGLLDLDASGKIVPSIAHSWSASPEWDDFRFQVHRDLSFSDGQAATTEAIADSIRRSLDPRRNSLHARDLAGIKTVRAVSAQEVQICTDGPAPTLPWYLAWRHYVVADTELQPTGLGPYQLVEWIRGDSVRLRRNPAYRLGPMPHFENIHVEFAPTSEVRRERALTGEFDFIETLPPALVSDEQFKRHYEVIPVASGSRTILTYNARKNWLGSAQQRRHVARMVDVDQLQHRVLGEAADHTGTPKNFSDRTPAPVGGVTNTGPIRLAAPNISPVQEAAHEIARQLEAHGLAVSVALYDDPPWWPLVYPGLSSPGWDLAIQSMPARPHPAVTLRREYCSDGPFNATGIQNSTLDELALSLDARAGGPEADEIYRQAMAIADEACMYTELYRSHYSIAVSKRIKGATPHSMNFWNVATLYT
ncbi:hypothetical protein Vqi01_56940 [Micromonospora qiuiae]|uniref:Solute-binding protein family 5 domain-containing protein n=1 Tax=Micromonospora qiuiae TaxID=502268 RepID=A0ABQ4JLZ5_9ACTN|nr:ABC transporter substrate-binding protein [Micromonospora qiuiae]GIJ30532.1 hypothetical protein Vqi01_56940 [Micromonospora qiuiae]